MKNSTSIFFYTLTRSSHFLRGHSDLWLFTGKTNHIFLLVSGGFYKFISQPFYSVHCDRNFPWFFLVLCTPSVLLSCLNSSSRLSRRLKPTIFEYLQFQRDRERHTRTYTYTHSPRLPNLLRHHQPRIKHGLPLFQGAENVETSSTGSLISEENLHASAYLSIFFVRKPQSI